jgi:mono/diheme cytochrome c family protein
MNWLLATRTRVMLLSLLVLAALDVARSVYARTAYSRPLGLNLTWPPGSDVKAGASPGEKVFAKHCAVCHGPDGKGNGPAAPSMKPRPRDFTAGEYKYKTTAQGSPPTDGDLVAVVKQGLIASGMPYFSDVLSDDEIRDVVRHIKGLGNLGSAPAPVQISPRAAADTASIARGKELYVSKGCAQCHGFDYHGVNKYQDAKGAEVPIRDLTAPWTFRGGADPEQVWLRLTVGMTPGPMPSYEGATTPEEHKQIARAIRSGVSRHGGQLHWQGMIWDLLSNMDEEDLRAVIAYLRTLPPVRMKIPSARPPAADDCAIYSFYVRGDMTHPGCR